MNCGVDVLNVVNDCCGVDLRLLARLGDQQPASASLRAALPRPVRSSHLEFEAAGGAKARDRRRIEAQRESFRDGQELGRTAATMAEAFCSGPRSSHGFRMANSTAELD